MMEIKNASHGRIWDMVFSRVVADEFSKVNETILRGGSHERIFERAEYIADLALFQFQKRVERWNDAERPEFKPGTPDEQSPSVTADP